MLYSRHKPLKLMWDSNLTTSSYASLYKHKNSYKSKFTKPSCLVMNDYPKLTVHLYNGSIIYIKWIRYLFLKNFKNFVVNFM